MAVHRRPAAARLGSLRGAPPGAPNSALQRRKEQVLTADPFQQLDAAEKRVDSVEVQAAWESSLQALTSPRGAPYPELLSLQAMVTDAGTSGVADPTRSSRRAYILMQWIARRGRLSLLGRQLFGRAIFCE